MMTSKMTKAVLAVIFTITLVGCGGAGSGGDGDANNSSTTSGVLVDPYIVGATLYLDENNNSQYDAGEPVSTKTDANGSFSFDKNLTAGCIVRIKIQGMHEGVKYDLNISAKVKSDKTVAVVSPLTAFEERGLSAEQIAEILNHAAGERGLYFDNEVGQRTWSIAKDKVLTNPLQGEVLAKTVDKLTVTDLVTIQASLASYGLLKIIETVPELNALQGQALYESLHSGILEKVVESMLFNVVNSINSQMLNYINTAIVHARETTVQQSGGHIDATMASEGLPVPTAHLTVKVSIAFINRVVAEGYAASLNAGGTAEAKIHVALTAVKNFFDNHINQDSMVQLGKQMYGLMYHGSMKKTFSGQYSAAINGIFGAQPYIQVGYEAGEDGKTTFVVTADGTFKAQ